MEATNTSDYASWLGERLRNVRQQQGLSLHDVEIASHGELKASVVGAYERGERAISVARLRRLADFYRVPVAQLLPEPSGATHRPASLGLRIDLTRLEGSSQQDASFISRYLESIQSQRGDYNGRVITVRSSNVDALASVLELSPEELRDRLAGAGIAAS